MSRKPGSIYEVRPVSFERIRPLPFGAVNIYLAKGKSVDVWVEGETIMMTRRDEDETSGKRDGNVQRRLLRLAVRPGGVCGEDLQVEVLP